MGDHALTIRDVCERLGLERHSVVALIRSGQLRAVNVSLHPGGRPRWRIMADDLDAFLRRRTYAAAPPSARRRKRQEVPTWY